MLCVVKQIYVNFIFVVELKKCLIHGFEQRFYWLFYCYFLVLVYFFRKVNSEMFFNANRNSPWYLVAFGMIGTTLSGVTFISIPGEVGNTHWTYLTLVFGNCVGYIVIALVLLPLFYRQNLVSIYSWLGTRFGEKAG